MPEESNEHTEEAKSAEPEGTFEGEFEKFKDAECSADGRVYAKEGELYIPELGVVCYGAGPCGKPAQEIDVVMPCYHTQYIRTSDGTAYSRKDYTDIKKLKEFFDSHGKTLRETYKTEKAKKLKEERGLTSNQPTANAVEKDNYSKDEKGAYNKPNPAEVTSPYMPKVKEPCAGNPLELQVKPEELNGNSLEKRVAKGVKRDGKIVEYPDEGTLFVATDLHGDMDALEKVITAFEKKYAENARKGKGTYLLTLGDDIHKEPSEYEVVEEIEFDDSYKVLDRFDELRKKYGEDVVINLMGNHELAHLEIKNLEYAMKDGINQCSSFKRGLRKANGEKALGEFIRKIHQRTLVALTPSGIAFSHTGPIYLGKREDIAQAEYSSKSGTVLEGIMLRRIHDGLPLTLEEYLEEEDNYLNAGKNMCNIFGANVLIFGHTPPTNRFFIDNPKTSTKLGKGYAYIGNNIFIFSTGKNSNCPSGCFLELDLNKKITNLVETAKSGAIKICAS